MKPGLSAEVEIIVDTLEDVLQAPLQAVSAHKGEQVCFVVGAGRDAERRVVETGAFSDSFIEIKKGLEEGEVVLLRKPEGLDEEEEEVDSGQLTVDS